MTRLPCTADPDAWFLTGPTAVQAAKDGCRRCPARDACLRLAVAGREQWGVWGGLDPDERAALHQEPDTLPGMPTPAEAPAVDHSRAAYVAGAHGAGCPKCAAANAAYKATWLAGRASVTSPEASTTEQLNLFGRTA